MMNSFAGLALVGYGIGMVVLELVLHDLRLKMLGEQL